MSKKLSELKTGDIVYVINQYEDEMHTEEIWENSRTQGLVNCDVFHIRKSDGCRLRVNLDGTKSSGFNGAWYFTDEQEAKEFFIPRLRKHLADAFRDKDIAENSIRKYTEMIAELEGKPVSSSVMENKHIR